MGTIPTSAPRLAVVRSQPTTEAGFRGLVRDALQLLAARERGEEEIVVHGRGRGLVSTATAAPTVEALRVALRDGRRLEDGRVIGAELFSQVLNEELRGLYSFIGPVDWADRRIAQAAAILEGACSSAQRSPISE